MRNNAQFLSFTLLLTLINLGLIVGRLYEYSTFKNSDGSVNWCIMIARATGRSVGRHAIKYFNFRSKIQLDHPVKPPGGGQLNSDSHNISESNQP